MNKKYFKKILSFLLVVTIIFGQLGQTVLAEKEDHLNKKLEVINDSKIQVNTAVDLSSKENVDVIIEFEEEPIEIQMLSQVEGGKSRSLRSSINVVEKSHIEFENSIKKMKIESVVEINHKYKSIFNGVSMSIPANEIKRIEEIPEVKYIWSVEEVKLDPPINISDTSIGARMNDSLIHMDIDKLHKENITGMNVKVGVLDTGIDYNHPDLKDAYRGGWNFVELDYEERDKNDAMETTYKDWLKVSDEFPEEVSGYIYYTSHGTHVAGIIAGQGKNESEFKVKGVAPDIDLYGYRVLGPYGAGKDEDILAALDQAVGIDKMDVINMSLGSPTNNPLAPLSIGVDNATRAGVACVISAGNSGPKEYTLGSPGAAALAITVGASSVDIQVPIFNGTIDGNPYIFKLLARDFYENIDELENKSFKIIDGGFGTESDLDINLEENKKSDKFEDKIILIERGGDLSFHEKMINAKFAGARGTIIFNNEEGDIPYFFGENNDYLLSMTLTKEEGENIKAIMNEDSEVTFLNKTSELRIGDELGDFSSRGPSTYNYGIKPDIVAPGVDILSTAPKYINDKTAESYDIAYQRMSGTSMSAPQVSGIAALIIQNYKDENINYKPEDIKASLMNTATDLKELYSVFDVGAGKVNPWNAVFSGLKLTVVEKARNIINGNEVEVDNITGSISFGSHYRGDSLIEDGRDILIKNKDSKEKNFKTEIDFISTNNSNISIIIPENINISEKEDKKVELKVEIPGDTDQGIYEGYINFKNIDDINEYYRIPFAIRIGEKGIEYMRTDQKAFTSVENWHPYVGNGWGIANIYFNSPMEEVTIYLNDGDTGNRLGLLGTLDGSSIRVGNPMAIQVFNGKYYEIDENNNIISEKVAEEGFYEIEIVAIDEFGDEYIKKDDLFFDLTPPAIEMELDEGIHELDFKDSDEIKWIRGNIYDSNIDFMNSKGYQFDQSHNKVHYIEGDTGMILMQFPVNEDGDFKFGIEYSDISDNKDLHIRLFGHDYSRAGNYFGLTDMMFVEKGAEYGTIKLDNNQVNLGDEMNISLGLNNAKDLKGIKYILPFNGLFNLEKVKLNNEFKSILDDKGIRAIVSHELKDENMIIEVKLEGDLEKGIDGNLKILDIDLKLIEEMPKQFYLAMSPSKVIVYKSTGEEKEVPGGMDKFGFNPDILEIKDIYPSVDLDVKEGEEIDISFKAPRGGQANFKILLPQKFTEDYRVNNMKEVRDGIYTGKWKVPGGLNIGGLEIELEYEHEDGRIIKSIAPGKINVIEDSKLPEKPEEPSKPIDPGKPIVPGKPEEPEEKPEEPKDPEDPEITELTDEEIEKILNDNFKDRKDIPSWAERAIGTLTNEKIVSGRVDGKFDPSANISRAEFLKMLVESLKLEKNSEKIKDFRDVKSSDWFKDYVDIGYSNGVILGISKDEFGPNLNISRQDLSVMVYNAVKDLKLEADGKINKDFNDEKEISGYAKEAVGELSKLGIISGKGENEFAPKENATRAEAAVIIYRLLELMSK